MLIVVAGVPAHATSLNPCLPVRAAGVNEGFADLPGYSLGWSTTMTTDNDADRGFAVVKIWPIYEQLKYNNQLDAIFNDDRLKVVVFRPFYNQTANFQQQAVQTVSCGQSGFQIADMNTDYGLVAQQLYQRYGSKNKVVILTGWEADNQIDHLPIGNPTCAWPSAAVVASYAQTLENRQIGVENARQLYAASTLRVFHAVEVKQVPEVPSPGNPGLNVLERIIPTMISHGHPPDFISYSAWAANPSKIVGRLNSIASVSGLPHERIFVGEWGCTVGQPGSGTAANRASCFSNHAANTFNWGARLWFVWTYAGRGGYNSYDLVFGPLGPTPGADSANGFSVLTTIDTTFRQTYVCP